MSGGSLDYAYQHVERAAAAVREQATTSLQRAFADHLDKVARALYALEWTLSGDCSAGSDVSPIRAVVSEAAELATEIERAHAVAKDLQSLLEKATRGKM